MTQDPSPMLQHLARLKTLRVGRDADFTRRLMALKGWQTARLAATYADLARNPRYKAAVDFFLEDLYAPKDFSARDGELVRIHGTLVRLLPASAVETVTLAIELDALAEEFDQALTLALPGAQAITAKAYCEAFRTVGGRDGRLHQVSLVTAVGQRLDELVRKPLIFTTLKMLRRPARMAGLGDLQDFLERGFSGFRQMGGAEEFLATIARRETLIMERIFASAADPFKVS